MFAGASRAPRAPRVRSSWKRSLVYVPYGDDAVRLRRYECVACARRRSDDLIQRSPIHNSQLKNILTS